MSKSAFKNQPHGLALLLLASLLVSLLLSACAAAPAAPAENAAPAATQALAQTEAPAATEAPAETEAPTAPEAAAAIEMTDGMGRQVSLPGPAQRIVSIAPSNTEILFAIGAGKQVVGRELFSDYPEEAKAITEVGGNMGELNMELIVSLKPDLILAAEITPPEQVQAMEELGLTVFLLKNPTDLEGMYASLETVGQLTGHTTEAQQLIQDLKARVAAVQEKVANVETRPVVFYELDSTDPDNPYTAGPGTFVDTLLQMAGGQNLGSDLTSSWAQISVETLLERDPDLILLGDYTWGGVKPEDVKARENWAGLKAVQNDQIFTFDDNLVSRPGPRLVDGLEALARLLHPELFQ